MKKIIFLSALLLWATAIPMACSDDDDHSSDSDSDTDSDSDSDSDTDSDTDTDTDTDPETFTDTVEFDTTLGSFVISLYGNAAPITVDNFLAYVDEGFYEDKIFHRVIPGFMIQGGGMDQSMTAGQTNAPIELEIVDWIFHEPGVISMARTIDPNSATSQFFVCVDTETSLDGEYAAFGETISGYDVVEAISLVTTHSVSGYDDVPVTPVIINSVTRVEQ